MRSGLHEGVDDIFNSTPMNTLGNISVGLPLTAGDPSRAVATQATLRARESWRDILNPWLILAALVYLAWSYFALASSIWARFFLLCYLILRMKPDTIVPLMLTCLQVRMLFLVETNVKGGLDPLADVYESLTGFEAYTFSLPPVLFMARTFLAFWERGGTVSKSGFPGLLFRSWWCGLLCVVAGALTAMASGRGWTGALRSYCVLGTCFYGMLLPTMSLAALDRLVKAFSFVAIVILSIACVTTINTRLLFVLAPIASAYGYFCIRGFVRGRQPLLGAAALAASAYYVFAIGTFTQQSIWIAALGCAMLAWNRAVGRTASAKPLLPACLTIALACGLVFTYAISLGVAEKMQIPDETLEKVRWKLIADRGPIWLGAVNLLRDQPYFVPTPSRPYEIQQGGRAFIWKAHTHNLVLDCLREFGVFAGPIAIVVLFGFTFGLLSRFNQYGGVPTAVLAISLFTSVVVGGLTLPYMITDRQAEPMLIACGAAWTTMGVGLRRSTAKRPHSATELQATA
jgi:hypothetical protein